MSVCLWFFPGCTIPARVLSLPPSLSLSRSLLPMSTRWLTAHFYSHTSLRSLRARIERQMGIRGEIDKGCWAQKKG